MFNFNILFKMVLHSYYNKHQQNMLDFELSMCRNTTAGLTERRWEKMDLTDNSPVFFQQLSH